MISLNEALIHIPALFIAAVFFAIIFIANWLGYKKHKRTTRLHPDKEISLGTSEGSLLGLMALLLAFSFSMASTKFESRRQTIIDEANLLNTSILRCDLYSDSIKKSLLPLYKNYLESRINYYNAGDNPVKIQEALDDANKQFKIIWNNVIPLMKGDNYFRTEQMVQLLISLKNMAKTREAGRNAAVPAFIIIVLLTSVVIASFLAGFGTKPGHRSKLLSVAFILMTTIVLYVVMELNRPRQGLINLNGAEQNMVDIRQLFP
jgi:hypothetical protein